MGKTSKIAIKYRYGSLPEHLGETLRNADETDLRILVAVMMTADADGVVTSVAELPALLGMEQSEVDASLKFWRGAGVIGAPSTGKTKKTADGAPGSQPTKKSSAAQTAHRGGVIERSGALEQYSSSELADLMEKRKMSAQFVDEAQRIFGKVFRTYDTGILMGIVDQLGFEEEAVLAILAYAARKEKKTLRYVEQVALTLYDAGVTETFAVIERIDRMERSGETVAKLRSMFGVGERELTATEKRLFTAWTEKYAYPLDVIRMAYDITVDNIQKPVPKYTNSILEKWYTEGLRTVDDVKSFLEQASAAPSGSTEKSYDVEDFFEAALRRSYENLQ